MRQRGMWIGLLWLYALLAAPAAAAVSFYAMADVPYNRGDDKRLPQQIAALPVDGRFVVHLGDIKRGRVACDEPVYGKVAAMLRQSALPVFIVPGDNEWNDCDKPAQGWAFWQQYFSNFDQHWSHRLPVRRQAGRQENFALLIEGVLFVGLNIVGGRVHDPQEWIVRHAAAIDWLQANVQRYGGEATSLVILAHAALAAKHDDFIAPLNELARAFNKPVLYLHGDGHRWIVDRPFAAGNILRVQLDRGGIAPPLKVTVTESREQPFLFDRRQD